MPSVTIDVGVEAETSATVLTVTGEVDLRTAPELRTLIDRVLDEGASRLVVDLAGVDFLDSTGLSVLVGAHKRLARTGGRLVVANPPEIVSRVLSITGLDRVFELQSPASDA